jgi:hypothetical protein
LTPPSAACSDAGANERHLFTIRLMPEFVAGIQLSRAFYDDVLAPALGKTLHSAALLGSGSDVLGFDTPRSTDHGWGPRLQVFVADDDVERVRAIVEDVLPDEFRGWPTRYGWDAVPVSDHVEVATLRGWLRAQLGFDPLSGIDTLDWLSTPQQVLLEMTEGAVFHDGLGELRPARDALAWYPDGVWLWILACQWRRIDQEEAFPGRAAEAGDELGARILTARLVRDAIRLCFLLERRYAPYSKWLGSAFRRLDGYGRVGPPILDALAAPDHPERENALVTALQAVAALHNGSGVTRRVDDTIGFFHDRPFRVLGASRFVDACLERVADPRLKALPLVGAVDQLVDSTDVLSDATVFPRTATVYGT